MNPLRMVFILMLLVVSRASALVVESGTLRNFVLGHCRTCAYDNWISHVSEGVAAPGLNDYGPPWFDPQMNGFGSFTLIPQSAAGDTTLSEWRAVFTAANFNRWTSVDSLLALQTEWRYELVEFHDTELNTVYHLLRERLDSSFVEHFTDSLHTGDVVGSFRNAWGLFVFNPSPVMPKLIIEMPHPEDDFLSIPVGLELFIRTGARMMMIAGAGREVMWDTTHAQYQNDYSLSDPSRYGRAPFAICHETLFDLLYTNVMSQMVTVQMHSYDTGAHTGLGDIQVSAFPTDNQPNPPVRDRASHLDLIQFMGEYPLQGLPGHPEITRRVDQYVSLWSSPPYTFYAGQDTLPLISTGELNGAGINVEGQYSHRNHNNDVDPENFIHVEINEYPHGLWNPPQWREWLPGLMPATMQTFQLALEYYQPFIAAMDSALRFTYLYPDTVPPRPVHLDQVIPVSADSAYLHWTSDAVDRFFDTYLLYYDTTISNGSPFIARQTSGYAELRDYHTHTAVVGGFPLPISRYRFAIGSRDLSGNLAIRSNTSGRTGGEFVITTQELLNDSAGGNNDSLADCGERVALTLTEENIGTDTARGVSVSISSADPGIRIMDSTAYYGTMPWHRLIAINNGFTALIAADVADEVEIPITVTATDSAQNQWQSSFNIKAHAPVMDLGSSSIEDSSGNNNGVMDAGEAVRLSLMLTNAGSARAYSLRGLLTTDYPFVSIPQPACSLASLGADDTDALSAVTVNVLPNAPSQDRAIFYLALTTSGTRSDRLLAVSPIGGLNDAVENGQGAWAHAPNQTGWTDQWHISSSDFSSPTHAWKCGDTGNGNYASHMDAVLVSRHVPITVHSELHFQQRMDAEVSSANADSAYDGGVVEISVNGNAWQPLTPNGGYNAWIKCLAGNGGAYTGPFAGRTPCFSGTIGWSEVVCDLGALRGDAQFRFRFGSDNATSRIGWFVDDISVVPATADSAPHSLHAGLVEAVAQLTWNSPPSTITLGTLRGYNVYRNGVVIAPLVQALVYADTMSRLSPGTYLYTVTAQFSNGESPMSNQSPVLWNPPVSVRNLTLASDNTGRLWLRWTPTGADYYAIYSSFSASDFSNAVRYTTASPPFVLPNDLSAYTARFYRVVAVRGLYLSPRTIDHRESEH